MSEESAGARVTDGLRERVRTGALAPGTVLSQSGIAAEYGVSRIPVRDALHVLAGEGLVQLGVSSAVVAGLSISELQELYELREAVEPVVTALAFCKGASYSFVDRQQQDLLRVRGLVRGDAH